MESSGRTYKNAALADVDPQHDLATVGRDGHLRRRARLLRQDDLEANRQRLLRARWTTRHGEGQRRHGHRGGDRGRDPPVPAPAPRDRARPGRPREGVPQLADRLPAFGRILGEAGQHHLLERRRCRRLERRDRDGLPLEDPRHHARRTLGLEGVLAGQHLVEHETEREDVRALVGRLAVDLLRGHVPRRAQDRPVLGERRLAFRPGRERRPAPGQTEVQHLHPGLRHQDVRGLEVAVDDAVAVRVLERIRDLAGEEQRSARRNRASQGPAFHELHHEVVRPHVEQRADVGVVERRHGQRLVAEALLEALLRHLHRDRPLEPRVAGLVDVAHPARAHRAQDLVGTEPGAGSQKHRRQVHLRASLKRKRRLAV